MSMAQPIELQKTLERMTFVQHRYQNILIVKQLLLSFARQITENRMTTALCQLMTNYFVIIVILCLWECVCNTSNDKSSVSIEFSLLSRIVHKWFNQERTTFEISQNAFMSLQNLLLPKLLLHPDLLHIGIDQLLWEFSWIGWCNFKKSARKEE